ncbi:DUF418 domain-containing protein [Bacillus clarus]|uniref:DUF418 domain-containing protein n=1 Tax=Bacillus clarus TaxID=2338372 RepID=A0A090YNG2_9BACI|nr:DUF418 domain-containing protein [Bacillus clarus]KFM99989.1 hypothetical protein DJ93_5126 [Bacillus clarus]RFT64391.1 DUF418 domain-containing protein [Bacillus clarus]
MLTFNERIRLLDVLRGFAILGTLGTNIWIFAHLGDASYIFTFNNANWWSSFDDFVRIFILFLVNGKLLGLLTIMFGVGLELKYQQSLRKRNTWPGMYLWTSFILVVEGFVHFALVMEYDILMSYGITAIIVSFIIKHGNTAIHRTMKIIGFIHAFAMLSILVIFMYFHLIGNNISLGNMQEVTALYSNGTWFEQIQYRLTNFIANRMEAIIIIPMNIFLFLLGIRLTRIGAFSPSETGKQIRTKMLKNGIMIGIPLNLLVFIPGGIFDLPVRYLFAPFLSVLYIALIAKLMENFVDFWLWNHIEKVGKMSLSCYVLQNIVTSILFYGWGFGLGGNTDSISIVFVWICICIFEVYFATFWLKKFKLGPMESARKYTSNLINKT